jgi:hypothetical protein
MVGTPRRPDQLPLDTVSRFAAVCSTLPYFARRNSGVRAACQQQLYAIGMVGVRRRVQRRTVRRAADRVDFSAGGEEQLDHGRAEASGCLEWRMPLTARVLGSAPAWRILLAVLTDRFGGPRQVASGTHLP